MWTNCFDKLMLQCFAPKAIAQFYLSKVHIYKKIVFWRNWIRMILQYVVYCTQLASATSWYGMLMNGMIYNSMEIYSGFLKINYPVIFLKHS